MSIYITNKKKSKIFELEPDEIGCSLFLSKLDSNDSENPYVIDVGEKELQFVVDWLKFHKNSTPKKFIMEVMLPSSQVESLMGSEYTLYKHLYDMYDKDSSKYNKKKIASILKLYEQCCVKLEICILLHNVHYIAIALDSRFNM